MKMRGKGFFGALDGRLDGGGRGLRRYRVKVTHINSEVSYELNAGSEREAEGEVAR